VTNSNPNLELRDLLKLAAFVSVYSPHVIESPRELPAAALEQYWHASRNRNHSWIRRLQPRPSSPTSAKHLCWNQTRRLVTEVFVSEVLTRVWTSVLVASDRRQAIRYAEPIARSVLVGHLEARRCCLELMVNGADVPLHELIELDRIRRRAERWTDVLLGPLVRQYPVSEFAFDTQRAADFARDLAGRGPSHLVWTLVLAGVQLAFADDRPGGPVVDSPQAAQPSGVTSKGGSLPTSSAGLVSDVASDQLAIVQAILACFPADAFTEDGVFKSLVHLRASRSGAVSDRQPELDFSGLPAVTDLTEMAPQRPPGSPPPAGISFRQLRKRWPPR